MLLFRDVVVWWFVGVGEVGCGVGGSEGVFGEDTAKAEFYALARQGDRQIFSADM